MRRWLLMAGLGIAGMVALAVGTVCLTAGCSTVGYYAMVGIFLKSFDVPTPTGDTPLK